MAFTGSREVAIQTDQFVLEGTLTSPSDPVGLVAFAHGSGSGRFSPRNQSVARALNEAGFVTLLLDLLTVDESVRDAHTREFRFNIDLLEERVIGTLDWLAAQEETSKLPIALFGASTGAAAALLAAAARPEHVCGVVSRGGRPDLAGAALQSVRAPTLLIVGGRDEPVVSLNEGAAQRLACPHELAIVPGATHLFEEPGALDRVVGLATSWFRRCATAG